MFLKNIVSFQDFFGKENSGSEDSREAGEVGTGRWKVPTYKDYLNLFRSLLNCDTMKVKAYLTWKYKRKSNPESYHCFSSLRLFRNVML